MNNDGSIIITDENNNTKKVQLIFNFQIPEFNKSYIVYTFDEDKSGDEIDVIISEFDSISNEIKSIPEDQKDVVYTFYEEAKKKILGNDE